MRVSNLMSKHVTSIEQGESLGNAAQLMWDCDCGAIPVRDERGKIVGIVTDRDICMATWSRGVAPAEIRCAEAMSSPVHCCSPEDSIATAESLMRANKIRRVPVVDREQRLVGIISLADIAQSVGSPQHLADPDLSPERLAMTVSTICEGRTNRKAA